MHFCCGNIADVFVLNVTGTSKPTPSVSSYIPKGRGSKLFVNIDYVPKRNKLYSRKLEISSEM
jgi:hypothetical protein